MTDNNSLIESSKWTPPSLAAWSLAPGSVDLGELRKPTPETQVLFQEIKGGKGYNYLDINYIYQRLNAALGLWAFYITYISKGDIDEEGNMEVMVFGVLKAGGLPEEGVPGIGSDKFRPDNKMDNYANTIKSARADAVKDAARFLGIGVDVRVDPKINALVEKQKKTIEAIIKDLNEAGKAAEIKHIFNSLAEQALSVSEEPLPNMLTEDQIGPVRKALIALAQNAS